MMDAIWDWAKHNFDLITLFVGILGVVIGVISLFVDKKKSKKEIAYKIAEKQAELDVINSTHHYIDLTTMNNSMIRKSVLEKEIDALKKKL